MCGDVEFTIDETKKELKKRGYVCVKSGANIEIANIGDHDAILTLIIF